MIYYAIRRITDGFYLPSGRRKGFTHDEPENPKVYSPRLFTRLVDAKNALRWWLEGRTTVSYHGEDEEDWHTEKVPTRNAENMQIVKLELIEL